MAYTPINSGTDYPPATEAWIKTRVAGQKVPEPVIRPYENATIGMTHGYCLDTDRVQVVVVHINVGLANTACGITNLVNSNIPVLAFGGRTPINEYFHFGRRNTPIDYGQGTRDQAALIRGSVKRGLELRLTDQIDEHIDRTQAIASSLSRGPAYLSLSRGSLCGAFAIGRAVLQAGPSQQPAHYTSIREGVARTAEAVTYAGHSVVFTQHGARTADDLTRFNSLMHEWAIPLVGCWGTEVTLSADNPLFAGADPSAQSADVSVILTVDSRTPQMIAGGNCYQNCTVIQMSPDPLFSRYPVRGYHADIDLTDETGKVFSLLEKALYPLQTTRQQHVAEWATHAQHRIQQQRDQRGALLHASQIRITTRSWLSYCLGHLANQRHGRIVPKLIMLPQSIGLIHAESYYQRVLVDGLSKALPIALGLQPARRKELIIAAVNDGLHLLVSPAVCHHIAGVVKLPVLVVVGNNGGQDAIADSTGALYPDGCAARARAIPTTTFTTPPDFVTITTSNHMIALSTFRVEGFSGMLEEAVFLIHTRR